MKIGYACKIMESKKFGFKGCLLKNATIEKLHELIEHNLIALSNMIDYNITNNIKLFRISSDLIPFGSSEYNQIKWWEEYREEFEMIGKKIKNFDIRVSMHPGQYTVLNSPNPKVVNRAILDLVYHARILDSLMTDQSSKIILHIGGVYNDKKKAISRFIHNYRLLGDEIKKRLVIENDDRCFNINDVLHISQIIKVPVVFDTLHHQVLPPKEKKNMIYWIKKAKKTWIPIDGVQKIHYSQQDITKKSGAHSQTIDLMKFTEFLEQIDFDVDIMLEVKDKNISAIKCIQLMTNKGIKN